MKPLAITCGDPAGVGPEIIGGWVCNHAQQMENVVMIGPPSWLSILPSGVNQWAVGTAAYRAVAGRPDEDGAVLAWEAMRVAAAGCVSGEFAGVVTGPVSKAQLAAVGYPHPGQTEFFAAEWGGDPVMAFRGDHLRVTLATWHIPLRDVASALTSAVLERAARAAAQLVKADGIAQPRIAVCGLNPHAGEGGVLGREEIDMIDPWLDRLRGEIPGLSRTLPGDTVFGRALRGDFDAVVALYHDQGLGPLKTIDFDNAVNVTLGLPHVRTSPDHGTAFGIAGQGRADITSFARAVELARRLSA
ncbi:MAG: 4-hydroxythreonine-4-phosphate dehydrogenase PdxA [Candidatus Synoicihabitans palmerolidicus]|nr:4-hydroxythreonine-4-phosphate dehydrogenase PdxA [Candidatus Synoicihabitans palmerolidicus]